MATQTTQKDFSFSIEKQAAWGTLIDTSPIGLPTEELAITIEPTAHRFNRSRGVRGTHDEDSWQDTSVAIPTASTTVMMTPPMVEMLVPGILQARDAWSAVGNVWTMYTIGEGPDLPSPKSDDTGVYYTLGRNTTVSGQDVSLTDAVMTTMTLTVDPVDNDGVLMAACEFIGTTFARGATLGAPTQSPITIPYKWSGITAVSWDGDDLTDDFVSAEISITSGAKLQGDTPNGEAQFPMWEVQGKIKILANAFTEYMKAEAESETVNDAKKLIISWGDNPADSSGELNIELMGLISSYSSDFAEGETIEFTIDGMFTADGDDMLKIVAYVE